MDKEIIVKRQEEILNLLEKFCEQKLDQEYFELATKLVKKLGRKRNVPFATGKIEIWAAAVVHALGTINFLFDKSSQPYCSLDEISQSFGASKSTLTGKSKQIRDMLKINHFDRDFSLRRIQEKNPFNKMVMVDGFMTLVNTLPPEIQQLVQEARAEGRDISFETRQE